MIVNSWLGASAHAKHGSRWYLCSCAAAASSKGAPEVLLLPRVQLRGRLHLEAELRNAAIVSAACPVSPTDTGFRGPVKDPPQRISLPNVPSRCLCRCFHCSSLQYLVGQAPL